MPELPEVETTLRGIQPHLEGQKIKNVVVRQYQLRWRIPADIQKKLHGRKVVQLQRRGKYLLMELDVGTVILHLGMSGSLRILLKTCAPHKHDHVDMEFANGRILRFTDPRRFGALLWTDKNPVLHPLLKHLGPEPLAAQFTGNYLWSSIQNKTAPIKTIIMDSKIVTGVGNIYATEALFLAGVHPRIPAKSLSQTQASRLVKAIKQILRHAIKRGGTTLKDFVNSEGKPGYFVNQLKAYGRAGLPCLQCQTPLESFQIGQRTTTYCRCCQT
jgi:formamidopyrimidine-DNA glycosylase